MSAWPELVRAREEGLTQIVLRHAPDRSHIITAAAPVGLDGETLLLTRNPIDIVEAVRRARSLVALVVLVSLLVSTMLSLFLARTIVQPLRELVQAAVRVRQGRDRQVQVPRLPQRRDEIGLLARAVSDMTIALRHRIDAVESFAADVAHEIKNPLASLRSATELLGTVDDPELRAQLLDIARHDVRRIDRLVTEISDASRIDAELSRATFEPVDLVGAGAATSSARANIAPSPKATDFAFESSQRNDARQRRAGAARTGHRKSARQRSLLFAAGRHDHDSTCRAAAAWVALSRARRRARALPEELREDVFKRFHSLRPEGEDFGNHFGLGLAIARSIAEAHDGTLVATSRPDGHPGACMILGLPTLRKST